MTTRPTSSALRRSRNVSSVASRSSACPSPSTPAMPLKAITIISREPAIKGGVGGVITEYSSPMQFDIAHRAFQQHNSIHCPVCIDFLLFLKEVGSCPAPGGVSAAGAGPGGMGGKGVSDFRQQCPDMGGKFCAGALLHG